MFLYGFLFFFCFIGLFFSKKPGYTIIYFISLVLLLSIILFFLSLEFLAFSLLYIYVGGIMVLFIFLIMMLGDFYPTFYRKQSKITKFSLPFLHFVFTCIFYSIYLYFFTFNYTIDYYVTLPYVDYFAFITYETDIISLSIYLFHFFLQIYF